MKYFLDFLRVLLPCGRSPSWGAWIEISLPFALSTDIIHVAPPRGERGLKYFYLISPHKFWAVAPPRGERGLKCQIQRQSVFYRRGRSPSWGAWIEITRGLGRQGRPLCRSPSWGAWIEIIFRPCTTGATSVAPPRGERGLKYPPQWRGGRCIHSRSPSWGAWIEMR